jgi:hypothetical protein
MLGYQVMQTAKCICNNYICPLVAFFLLLAILLKCVPAVARPCFASPTKAVAAFGTVSSAAPAVAADAAAGDRCCYTR